MDFPHHSLAEVIQRVRLAPSVRKLGLGLLALGAWGQVHSQLVQPTLGIVGKNGWLFYRYELADLADEEATEQSLGLIERLHKVLHAQGVTLAVTFVPLKMRIYAEHLPANLPLSDYLARDHDRMSQALLAARVNFIDINQAFLKSPKRSGDTPYFFRQDSHWSPAGALFAAETVQLGVQNNPALKKAYDRTPPTAFTLTIAPNKAPSPARDLVDQLPRNSPALAPEKTMAFAVERSQPAKPETFGTLSAAAVTLVGSSYSIKWTGFADALRFTLQRDLLALGVPANQGAWVGMEAYLRNLAFQTQPPKLLIWEIPERDLKAPPNFRYREERYVNDNTEWLLRASAWAQLACRPSGHSAKLTRVGLGADPVHLKRDAFATSATTSTDFIEFTFSKPIERLDYLVARISAPGSQQITFEGSGPSTAPRRVTVATSGEDHPQLVKTPLLSDVKGFTTLRIYPGKSRGFKLDGLQVCRQPPDLLQ